MTFFGETIRKAREAKGLSTSQVAERTHILVQIIEAMEREDFKRIPAAIYGRGFVRHIAQVLEIDAKPLVAEFMDIYEGRKAQGAETANAFMAEISASGAENAPAPEPGISLAGAPDEAASAEAAMPETDAQAPGAQETGAPADDAVKGLALFEKTSAIPPKANPFGACGTALMPAPERNSPIPPPPKEAIHSQDIFASAYRNEAPEIAGPSAAEKFRQSLGVVSHGVIGGVRKIPRSAWRMAVLALGAVIVVSMIVWGCKTLYRITEVPAPAAPTAAGAATKPDEKKLSPSAAALKAPAAAVKLRSTGQKVPPLYVD